jgi:hypothetical protein
MIVQDNFYQYGIDIIAYVMNQLSLKQLRQKPNSFTGRNHFSQSIGKN